MAEKDKKPVTKKEETEKVGTQKEKPIEKKSESAVQKAKNVLSETKEKKTKKEEKKETVVLEREYVVPLRKGFLKVPHYKRAKKAIKTLREFIVKHMKVRDRDLKMVKIDRYLNEEMWFRGIKKPPVKIKVKATKMSSGFVLVELAELPTTIKFKKAKDERFHKPANIKAPKHVEEKVEQNVDEKEKEEAVKEAAQEIIKTETQQAKHTTEGKHKSATTPRRKVMQR